VRSRRFGVCNGEDSFLLRLFFLGSNSGVKRIMVRSEPSDGDRTYHIERV
jgi:hypothetical protein